MDFKHFVFICFWWGMRRDGTLEGPYVRHKFKESIMDLEKMKRDLGFDREHLARIEERSEVSIVANGLRQQIAMQEQFIDEEVAGQGG